MAEVSYHVRRRPANDSDAPFLYTDYDVKCHSENHAKSFARAQNAVFNNKVHNAEYYPVRITVEEIKD